MTIGEGRRKSRGKIWMHTSANLRKTKAVSLTLVVIFLIAALVLNAGLLVVIKYGDFFAQLKEELATSDAYFLIPDALYTDEVKSYIDDNEHILQAQSHDFRWLDSTIHFNEKDRSFLVLFNNMDEAREISKWKYVGESLAPEEMSVYVPDIFAAVSGYQLNDTIELRYTDKETDQETSLVLTIRGYIEDVYFSSKETGYVSFFLPEDTYKKVEEMLNDPYYRTHAVFANVDDINNVGEINGGIRELLGLNTVLTGDSSNILLAVDLPLIESVRCTIAKTVSAMMVIFSAIIFLICLLVVRFRIVNSIEEDSVKMGSLKAMGYTSRQIMLSIIVQFCLLASVGSVAGILLSYPVLPYISLVFERQSGLKWEQGFDGVISTAGFLMMIGVVVLASWLASRRVSKLNPINALRGETTVRKQKRNYLSTEWFGQRLPVLLAAKSVLQNKRQYFMMAAILISVTFAGAYGVVMYYNTSVDTKAFAEVPGIEICNAIAVLDLEQDQAARDQAVAIIKGLKEVRRVQYIDDVKLKIEGTEVSAYVMDTYEHRESVQVYEGHYPRNNKEIVLAGILAERLDKKIGDTVSVGFAEKEEVFSVVGLSNGSSMGGLNVSVLKQDCIWLNPDFVQQSLNIYLVKGTDVDGFIQKMRDRLDKGVLAKATNFDQELADGMDSYLSIFATMGLVMLLVTMVVVGLVLYFVISSSIFRKRRELGVQKAVGFSTFQLMNQIALSYMFAIIVGAVLGSVLGALYTNPMMSAVMRSIGVMKATFVVDITWIAVFGAGTIVFSYLVALLVSWRIRKISAYALVSE